MGVDYTAIAGFGVRVTDKMIKTMVRIKLFTEKEWEEMPDDCMEYTKLPYSQAGEHSYGGELRMYFMVKGESLKDFQKNTPKLISGLNKIGINITLGDITQIADIYMW